MRQNVDLEEALYRWLGIPIREQPPNHYRLLGVALFEHDASVIESAADRQMAHVRSQAGGPNSATSQRVLNALSAAKLCLLDERQRAQYDAALRSELALAQAPTGVAPVAQAGSISVRAPEKRRRPRQPSEAGSLPAKPVPQTLIWGGVAVIGLLFFFMFATHAVQVAFTSRNDEPVEVASAKDQTAARKEQLESAPPPPSENSVAKVAASPKVIPAVIVETPASEVPSSHTPTASPAPTLPEPGPEKAPEPTPEKKEDSPPLMTFPLGQEEAKRIQLAWSEKLNRPVVKRNSIGMLMAVIPPGEFLMGTTPDAVNYWVQHMQLNGYGGHEFVVMEQQQHKVHISKPFAIGIYEVTIGQFRQFVKATGYQTECEKSGEGGMGAIKGKWVRKPKFSFENAGQFKPTDQCPVFNVTWNDANAFCDWLSKKEGMTYRLPTEAEWEYACRAGCAGHWSFGDDIQRVGDHAWFGSNNCQLHPVGQKLPNAWGLFDMHGNAQELCKDFFDNREFAKDEVTDPQGPLSGTLHVTRGGHEGSPEVIIRSAFRFAQPPNVCDNMHGFRVVARSAVEK